MAAVGADDLLLRMDRTMRHMNAAAASDAQFLRDSLRDAATRFSDLADIIEKDRTYDPVNFLRASAKRYGSISEQH